LDDRYIRIDDKPLFVIYKPNKLTDAAETIALWQRLAKGAGLKGLYIVGMNTGKKQGSKQKKLGFDASIVNHLPWPDKHNYDALLKKILKIFGKTRSKLLYQNFFKKPFHIYSFKDIDPGFVVEEDLDYEYFPCILSNWDNTPRFGMKGKIALNLSPSILTQQLKKALWRVENAPDGHRIVFIKSWNEWAEGNYLEPDLKYGHAYLQAVKDAVDETQ